MESMTFAISFLASLVVWFALRHWARDHRPLLIRLAHRIHGIRPLARRNTYLSTRRHAFMPLEEVRAAEDIVLRAVHWMAIPAVSIIPMAVGASSHL